MPPPETLRLLLPWCLGGRECDLEAGAHTGSGKWRSALYTRPRTSEYTGTLTAVEGQRSSQPPRPAAPAPAPFPGWEETQEGGTELTPWKRRMCWTQTHQGRVTVDVVANGVQQLC